MTKNMFISLVVLSGSFLAAGQAIGQLQPAPQHQESARTETAGNTAKEPLGTVQPEPGTRQDPANDRETGSVSEGDRQHSQDTAAQQPHRPPSPQQQMPLQRQFGVSPRFDDRDHGQSRQNQIQGRSDDQPGQSSDMTREPNPF